ncbi:hypothetical protein A2382_01590 [Candidatus Woesebacteria bacterium RIFOXYB1_FULL_38_16]|uniref:DUF2007 domain-containing protein n=1 Tax=Candidatus Woesebacteria bacterium RIFOXYB1_FULL_38_16 TaxID=1802538 RepID=A0A1F8CUW8_9BACT|nr:MAG: hypothetical protein A2191_03175 [Candidatus Woesebacteria bacterium RIFOXYA1_FULL_38_9]OGM80117.1 MAG: hypothetical protein A2382_01590 [Candidatus Woesebacteria bacterium RIFOXYB1_FULL_38_16]
MTDKTHILVKVCYQQIDAELVKQYLQAKGVPNIIIKKDNLGGMFPFPFSPSPNKIGIYVGAKDAVKAKNLLKIYKE